MPVINVTPRKTLQACDSTIVLGFTTLELGCTLRIEDESNVNVISYEYKFFSGSTLIDTVNSTNAQTLWFAAPFFAGEQITIRQTITATQGTFITDETVTLGSFAGCIVLEWDTTSASPAWDMRVTNTTPYYVYDGRAIQYLTGNGSLQTINHSGLTGTTTIQVIAPVAAITGLNYLHSTAQQTGTLDISGLSALTNFRAIGTTSTANNFSGITWPTGQRNIERMRLDWYPGAVNTGWIGNVSGFVSDGFRLLQCTGVTSLSFNAATFGTGATQMLIVESCANLTSLDVSNIQFSGGGARMEVQLCSSLATLTLPSTGNGGTLARLLFNSLNSLSGTLDISGYTVTDRLFVTLMPSVTEVVEPTLGAALNDLQVFSMTGLTTYTRTGGTGNIRTLRFSDLNTWSGLFDTTPYTLQTTSLAVTLDGLNYTAAQTNEALVNLDGQLGAGSGTISMTGSNAAPDTTSGGFNGAAAKTSLQGKGYTVNTN